MDSKILLENGTNELEVLEFVLDGNSYGINVAKIKEIIAYQTVTPVPNAHPSLNRVVCLLSLILINLILLFMLMR